MSKYKVRADYNGLVTGTVVYDARKYDYGLANDDTKITGIHHISVTEDAGGDYPFVTIPVGLLQELPDD